MRNSGLRVKGMISPGYRLLEPVNQKDNYFKRRMWKHTHITWNTIKKQGLQFRLNIVRKLWGITIISFKEKITPGKSNSWWHYRYTPPLPLGPNQRQFQKWSLEFSLSLIGSPGGDPLCSWVVWETNFMYEDVLVGLEVSVWEVILRPAFPAEMITG